MNERIVNSLIHKITRGNILLKNSLSSYQSPDQNTAVFHGSKFFKTVASILENKTILEKEIANTSTPTLLEAAKKQIEESNKIIEAIAKEKRPDTKNHNAFQKSFR